MFTISSDHLKQQGELKFSYFFQDSKYLYHLEAVLYLSSDHLKQQSEMELKRTFSYFGALSTKQTKVNNLAFFTKKSGN